MRYMSIDLTFPIQLLCIVITYILSIFSYYYIEQPFRKSRINSFTPVAIKFYLIPTLILVLVSMYGIEKEGYQNRFEPKIVEMEYALNTYSSESRKACHSAFRDHQRLPVHSCIIGEKSDSNITQGVFIFGDSHANHLVPFFSELIKDADAWGQDYTLDRCIPIIGLNWGGSLYKAKRCKERNNKALQHIKDNGFKYVVMAASWPGIDTNRIFSDVGRVTDNLQKSRLFENNLLDSIELIIETGAIPVLVEDTPTLGGKSPKCPIKKLIFKGSLDCDISLEMNAFISDAFSKLKGKYPQVIIIKPSELYCDKGSCTMELSGLPLYRDDDHLNEEGAKVLARKYLAIKSNFINLKGD